jgi:hypothetical protein
MYDHAGKVQVQKVEQKVPEAAVSNCMDLGQLLHSAHLVAQAAQKPLTHQAE